MIRGRRLALCLWAVLAAGHATAAEPVPRRFEAGDTVAWIGDSITRGGLFHSTIQLFHTLRYPARETRYFNAGRSGDAAPRTLQRLGWDVLERAPTTAVVMLGMNDMGGGFTADGRSEADVAAAIRRRLEQVSADYENLLDALDRAQVRLTLAAPSPYDDSARLDKPADEGRNAALALWTRRVRDIAERRRAGYVDFHTPLTALNHAGQAKDPAFTLIGADRIHPGPVGHFIMAWTFLTAQGHSPTVASVSFDVRKPTTVDAVNASVTDLTVAPGDIRFAFLAGALPFPVPNEARAALDLVPFMADLNQEVFRIAGLPPGRHGLWIDDEAVGSYSAEQFAAGIDLAGNTRTPQYRQAFAVARANAKRHAIESGDLRGMAWVRSSILEPAKVGADDAAGVERAFAAYRAKHVEPTDFGRTMIEKWPGWIAAKPKTEAALAEAVATMRDLSRPLVRRVAIRPVPASFGIDGQQFEDFRRRATAGSDRAAQDCLAGILRDAEKLLLVKPVSVMDKGIVPPSGDRHDYVSLATYYWPNPRSPDGLPYVCRDGDVNPETKDSDYTRMRTMIDVARGLALAYAARPTTPTTTARGTTCRRRASRCSPGTSRSRGRCSWPRPSDASPPRSNPMAACPVNSNGPNRPATPSTTRGP